MEEARFVVCSKLGKKAEGLDRLPFEGELGETIYNEVSKEAWETWSDEVMMRFINEYRLNLADGLDYEKLIEGMCDFLNIKNPINS